MTFIEKREKVNPGFNIGVILGNKATKGSVGIELEFEGERLLRDNNTPPPWVFHNDGSLRGKENAEYVLASPVEFSEVEPSLKILWDALEKNKAKFDESNRTSVHVHLNVQQFHLNRLTSFLALYFTVEEILTAWCGEFRIGNLFCLRAKDAPAIITQIKQFIQTDGGTPIPDILHYGGVNIHAMAKFGSLEFRSMRGVSDIPTIMSWINILERLYRLSEEFKDPRAICELFSYEGPIGFFENIMGGCVPSIRSGVNMSDDEIADAMYEGIRLAQELCYCRDWTKFTPVDLKPDPFGRDAKKLAKRRPMPLIPNGSFNQVIIPSWAHYAVVPQDITHATPQPVTAEQLNSELEAILDEWSE